MDDLSSWLTSTEKQREALFAHSRSQIPNDKGLLDADIEKSIRAAEAAGAQLAKMRYFLTEATKKAFDAIPADVKGLGREVTINDMVKSEQLLHDQLDNLARALNSRVKASCNGRRSLL